ncbi:uncharacterized protein ASCRUDRAFT_9496 [Ascoidea rubescens DSM 1968]|uniref:WW domain-containing protein n=1 Tax=Ascoidea rubescens DSM 1968 TaxID=1344418 RepID=A0A1D2VCU1_9ASCO|nr:hypothetical protein ASCRUDRAFT_9496 [Ascoidea rubescens DSM 1968]ODV59455.1 hypothetical protein ASCRUDRAFT_9496 [Ascoidea rubescens DSM 1968]
MFQACFSKSNWTVKYDPVLKSNYYYNSANGEVQFDNPNEVKASSYSMIRTNSSKSSKSLKSSKSSKSSRFSITRSFSNPGCKENLKKRSGLNSKFAKLLSKLAFHSSNSLNSHPNNVSQIKDTNQPDVPVSISNEINAITDNYNNDHYNNNNYIYNNPNDSNISFASYLSSIHSNDNISMTSNAKLFYHYSPSQNHTSSNSFQDFDNYDDIDNIKQSLNVYFTNQFQHKLSNDYQRDNIDDEDSSIDYLYDDNNNSNIYNDDIETSDSNSISTNIMSQNYHFNDNLPQKQAFFTIEDNSQLNSQNYYY